VASDHYRVLGVERDAAPDEIKRAFRALARQHHPDANPDPGAEARFKEINAAYEVLSDPVKRERYDLYGDANSAPGFASFGDLGDLMESFFGAAFGRGRTQARRGGPARGDDLSLEVEVSFEEAVFGTTKELTLAVMRACERCNGTACEPGTFKTRCARCGGTGELRTVQRSIFGQIVSARTCSECDGAGESPASPCTACRGRGAVEASEAIEVSVPAGVETGNTLRLDARGAAGARGGPNGDLYVHLLVRPHPVFMREGDHLLCSLTVPFTVAALGAEVPVSTLDGDETLRVPAGTQPGTLLRLRGKGVPHLGGRGRGDLVVQIDVEVPTKLRGEERELLEKLADVRGDDTAEAKGILGRIKDALRPR
jgi:molecular chaperone DnaJ